METMKLFVYSVWVLVMVHCATIAWIEKKLYEMKWDMLRLIQKDISTHADYIQRDIAHCKSPMWSYAYHQENLDEEE